MFDIWFAQRDWDNHLHVSIYGLVRARALWDQLAAGGFTMRSARP